ncbi:hypothetical protein NVP1170O_053 [Vibrio phage 1.170.O._10N.261.52.C3]|nr:hypothetical protein NVP1170O_053 [Vibrio phage 1.170.O._10N.261.52.C3]
MSIEKYNHILIAEDRPSSTLRGKEQFKKLMDIFLEKSQEIEDQFVELASQKDLETVTGVWLDYIGNIIGLARDGREDEDYREALKLKISINTSDGTPDLISEIMLNLTKPDRVRIAEGVDLHGQFLVRSPSESVNATTYQTLQEVSPVTSHLQLLVDLKGAAFAPAWETTLNNLDVFEVDNGSGVFGLDLLVSPNSTPAPMLVNSEGVSTGYLEGTLGFNTFEWEDDQGTTLDFNSWFWEVDLTTTNVTTDSPLDDFELATNGLYFYANNTLHTHLT